MNIFTLIDQCIVDINEIKVTGIGDAKRLVDIYQRLQAIKEPLKKRLTEAEEHEQELEELKKLHEGGAVSA